MLLLWLACEPISDPVTDCLSEYSPDAGYAWESDAGHGISAEDAEAECELGGGDYCIAADYLTRDAAFCLASLLDLSEGVEDWAAGLTYHQQYELVVWNVTSTDVSKDGYLAGEALILHATTGDLLGRSGWEANP